MERILDLNVEFDVNLFDEIVSNALNPSSNKKTAAENILLQFKDLPSSWTKIDCILKTSTSKQSHFIALQILEETVRSKWVLFNEEMKAGLRQYIFSTVIERSSQQADIILQKFNNILIEIVKRDWPLKWPGFINELITVSQSTSMQVSVNSLDILRNLNEQLFVVEDEITTTRKRLLRRTLKQEYCTIFQFISLILEYSETQDLDDALLESCLNAFKSFCKSMVPEFIFSTRIVDFIVGHLNSPHSIATLECLLEIIDLRRTYKENGVPEVQPAVQESEKQKIILIHSELLSFFRLYLQKFDGGSGSSKLHLAYATMGDQERMFVKKYAVVFSSLYSFWIYELNQEDVKQGLNYLVQLSKIEDAGIFNEVFAFWSKFVYEMYSEYPLRIPTNKPLRRNGFRFAFEAMLPVFTANMPRPEEVFLLVNEIGDIIRDKKVETVEIEFYKKMKLNLFYLSFCIEDFTIDFFIKKLERFVATSGFDHAWLNKLCWAMGSIANALEETIEHEFFISIAKALLTLCELRSPKNEKAIVASNIMFIIGQFYRFLKHNNEFMTIVVKKLFEFMDDDYKDIQKMACDNFFKICERCPSQFFMRTGRQYFYEEILNDLPSITRRLDYYLQRMVIEGLLIVLKHGQKKDTKYVDLIYGTMTNQAILDERYITSIHTVIHEQLQLKMAMHLVESYSLGFKIIPEIFHGVSVMNSFLFLYRHCSKPEVAFNTIVQKNLLMLKTSLAMFFETVVLSGYKNTDFINNLCEGVLLDFRSSFDSAILSLATAIVSAADNYDDPIEIQRLQFIVNNLIVPAVPYVIKADEHIELSKNYLTLLNEMSNRAFKIVYPILTETPAYESIISSVLFSLTGLREVSVVALTTLKLFFKYSLDSKVFGFFNRFYLICMENVLGLIFDKDMRQNYDLQVMLLYELISYLDKIPSLNNSNNNHVILREFIVSLFNKNFRNLTENTVKIFIQGILEIKKFEFFRDHLDDFNVKIYEYGDDEDIQDELDLLKERISARAN